MLSVIYIVCALCALWIFYQFKSTNKNGIPGPRKLPLIGNLHQIALLTRKKPAHEVYTDLSNQYGPMVSLKLGILNQIVIDDLDLMKEVLTSNTWLNHFENDYVVKLRSFGKNLGIACGQGAEWKEIRLFTTKALKEFGFGRNATMESIIAEESAELVKHITERIESEESEIRFKHFFTTSTLNIIWTMMAKDRFARGDKRLENIFRELDDVLNMVPLAFNISYALPFVGLLLPSAGFIKNVYGKMQDIVREKMDYLRTGNKFRDHSSFMDVFLDEIEKRRGLSDEKSKYYNDEQFITVVIDMLEAGMDTSSNTLEYAMLALALNSQVQEKVREEIDAVVGKHSRPTYAHMKSMPYTQAVILETQRVANVLPIIIRVNTSDTTLSGYFVPKGTAAVLNTYSCNVNDQLWKDPFKFCPERFLDGSHRVVNADKIIPFGAGKRICPGETVARATIFTILATLLQSFSFSLAEGEKPEELWMKYRSGFTLHPHPFLAKVVRRV